MQIAAVITVPATHTAAKAVAAASAGSDFASFLSQPVALGNARVSDKDAQAPATGARKAAASVPIETDLTDAEPALPGPSGKLAGPATPPSDTPAEKAAGQLSGKKTLQKAAAPGSNPTAQTPPPSLVIPSSGAPPPATYPASQPATAAAQAGGGPTPPAAFQGDAAIGAADAPALPGIDDSTPGQPTPATPGAPAQQPGTAQAKPAQAVSRPPADKTRQAADTNAKAAETAPAQGAALRADLSAATSGAEAAAVPATGDRGRPQTQPGQAAPQAAAPSGQDNSAAATAVPPVTQVSHALAALHIRPDGSSQLTIRLDPAELGHVQVQITRGQDGASSVRVAVERVETLGRLQADITHLHLALDRAGVPEQRNVTLHLAPQDQAGSSAPSGQNASSGGGHGNQGGSQSPSRGQATGHNAEPQQAGVAIPPQTRSATSYRIDTGIDITA